MSPTATARAGVVLVGDAFATSCPAAGTGTDKVLTDVERLCNVHIPHWLATDGMGADKIATFYDDPVKVACDAFNLAKAYHLRSLTLDNSLQWRAQRWARFLVRSGAGHDDRAAQATARSSARFTARVSTDGGRVVRHRRPAMASALHCSGQMSWRRIFRRLHLS